MSSKALKRRNSAHHKHKSPSRLKSKKSKVKRNSTNSVKLRSSPKIRKIKVPNNENNGYHADDTMSDPNDQFIPHTPDDTTRPTHKKNAVSSFFSIFSTINKRRKDSTQSDAMHMETMTDLEVLKRLKRRILDILCRILDSKPLKRIKSELKSEVWDVEYSELKKRLSTHDIHTATQRQKYSTVQSLKQLSSLNSNDQDEGDEDVREMATFLLQEYFDQPTLSKVDSMSTIKPQKYDQSNKATPVSVPHTIKEMNENMNITPIGVFEADYSYFDFDSTDDGDDELKSNHSNNNNIKPKRKRMSHRYSPRPMEYNNQNNKALDYSSTQHTANANTNKTHRIEIRNKFRRGVRKAMIVNAWCHISDQSTSHNPMSLSLSHLNDVIADDLIRSSSKSKKSPSYSSPFASFMSDNLLNALSKVGTWEFDPFEFFECNEVNGKGLVYSVWYLFDKYDIFKLFPTISPKKFMRFLTFVEEGYLDNPYHNKIHATDVVSNVAFYLNNTSFFDKHVSLFDKFTAILSAAVHDLGHDGNNNAYHITTMSDLAIRYNDISVLENYHIAQTFTILKKTECNWFSSLERPVQRYLRSAMIDIVLATDMKFHNAKLAQLTGLIALLKQQLNKKVLLREHHDSLTSIASNGSKSIPISSPLLVGNNTSLQDLSDINFDRSQKGSGDMYEIKPKSLSDFPLFKYNPNEVGVEYLLKTKIPDIAVTDSNDSRIIDVKDERRFVLCWVVHLADISNCAKSLKSGKKWAPLVMSEFFKQGDRERSEGLEVSAMMDRRRSSTPQGQVGFIKFILKPSYNMFARLVPEANKPLEILNDNLEYWQVQQTLMSQQRRKKRARSLGAIKDIKLSISNDKSTLSGDEMMNENDGNISIGPTDDEHSEHSELEMQSDLDQNDGLVVMESPSKTKKKVSYNKKVVFRKKLIIKDHEMDSDDESIESGIGMSQTPKTTMSYTSHSYHGSAFSGDESFDSLSLRKMRAHSIHVPIPTSKKQIAAQPKPFNSFMAELRKDYQDEEDEKSEQKKREKRRQRMAGMVKKSQLGNAQPVIQSISVPLSVNSIDAAISPKNSSVGSKKVFDVV